MIARNPIHLIAWPTPTIGRTISQQRDIPLFCVFFRRQLREEKGIPQTAALTAVIPGLPDAYLAGLVVAALIIAAVAAVVIFVAARRCRRGEPGKNEHSFESSESSPESSPKPAAAAGGVDKVGDSDAGNTVAIKVDPTNAAPAAADVDKEDAVDGEEETAEDKEETTNDKEETSKDKEAATKDKEEDVSAV